MTNNPSDAREAAYAAAETTRYEIGLYSPEAARKIADAAIDAFIKASSTEDGGEREIRERHERDENGAGVPMSQFEANIHHDRATLLSTTAALRAERDAAVKSLASTMDKAADEMRLLRSRVGELETERDTLEAVVTHANNSLFGSNTFFLSLDGGEPNEYHLADEIEKMKAESATRWNTVATLQSDLEQMRKALEGLIHGLPELLESIGYVDEEGLIAKARAALTHVPGEG